MPQEQAASPGREPVIAGRPLSVLVTQILFVINAAVWIVLGIASLWRAGQGTAGTSPWLLALLMLANAAVLAVLGWALGTRRWWVYYLALTVLLVNVFLGVTDQVGWLDVAVLLLNAVMLMLLLLKRPWYLAARTRSPR